MLLSQDLATLKIRRIIFHDVPSNPKHGSRQPLLADAITRIDAERTSMLKERLVRALGSKAAYPVTFASNTGSPIPAEVRQFGDGAKPAREFVSMSQRLAKYLFDQQGGNVSPGLLCVVDVASGGRPGLAVLKLERERGAELEVREENGKRLFEMSVLDNLVFTDGTRLFKAALFIRQTADDYEALVCDSQRTVTTSSDVARFWMRFLGCQVLEEPRVATQKWFDVSVKFVNDLVEDPVLKNDLYEHLVSELKSNRASISPGRFGEDYLPDTYRITYRNFLQEHRVSLSSFDKDLADIKRQIRRRAFHTANGVTVIEPAEEERSLVEVSSDQIVIHDQLRSVATK